MSCILNQVSFVIEEVSIEPEIQTTSEISQVGVIGVTVFAEPSN